MSHKVQLKQVSQGIREHCIRNHGLDLSLDLFVCERCRQKVYKRQSEEFKLEYVEEKPSEDIIIQDREQKQEITHRAITPLPNFLHKDVIDSINNILCNFEVSPLKKRKQGNDNVQHVYKKLQEIVNVLCEHVLYIPPPKLISEDKTSEYDE